MAKGIEKKIEIAQAKLRRGNMLVEFEASGLTQFKFAKKKKISPQRMSQLLSMARDEYVKS
jgi:hypothetical protein